MYELEYLPVAQQDMVEIVQYISQELKNPSAANRLAAALIEAGDRIPSFPYANPVYHSLRPLQHEYRKLIVRNFLLLYWVDEAEKRITIARVIYAKRDYRAMLE